MRLAINLFQVDLVWIFVVDFLKDFRAHFAAFVLLSLDELFKHIFFKITALLFFDFSVYLFFFFVELLLKASDSLFQFRQWPVGEVIPTFFRNCQKLLELLGVIVLFNDLCEEILLLIFVIGLHQILLRRYLIAK